MKLSASEIIKNLRSELGLSQEEFAERINKSTRQLSRIENDHADIHILDIVSILELVDIMQRFGRPMSDLSSLALKSNGYHWYTVFRKALAHLAAYEWDDFDITMAELEADWKKDHPYIGVIKAFSHVRRREYKRRTGAVQTFNTEDLADLVAAISISIDGFDEKNVADYLLVGHEIYLLADMARALKDTGEYERAKSLCQRLLNNKSLTVRLKTGDFPMYWYVMGVSVDVSRATGVLNDVMVENLNLINTYIKANSLTNLGRHFWNLVNDYNNMGEDVSICRLWAMRAYSWAEFRGFKDHIDIIRQEMKEKYNIDTNYMPD